MSHRKILICGLAALAVATPASAERHRQAPPSPHVAVDQLPVTNAPLQDFPFVQWPSDYQPQNTPKSEDVGHFFFWDGAALHDVEGRTFLVTLIRAGGGNDFNEYFLKKTIRSQLVNSGAVLVTASKIPADVLHTIPEVDRESLGAGLGDVWNDPVETWVIKRPNHTIWVHYTDNSSEASIAVVASPNPF